MEQKPAAQDDKSSSTASSSSSTTQSQSQLPTTRPLAPGRNDSLLPPHFRESVTAVPVTPGIGLQTYDSEHEDDVDDPDRTASHEPDYFSRKTVPHAIDHAIAPSPAPLDPYGNTFEGQLHAGLDAGKDFLRRLSKNVMGERHESLSDIRDGNPNLSLSGNIISATFSIPYSLRYRKGSDWVRLSFFFPLQTTVGVVPVVAVC